MSISVLRAVADGGDHRRGGPTNKRSWGNGALGRKLRERRQALGLGVNGLARELESSAGMVSEAERNLCRVPPARLEEWARALGIDPRLAARWWLESEAPEVALLLFGPDAKKPPG